MSVSDEFLEYVLDQLSPWGGVSARKMFGGAGLYRDGEMFGLIADDVAYLKVGETNRDQFAAAGSAAFKPYPNKPATMSYFEIPVDVLEDSEKLIEWSKASLSIQKRGRL
jgi:DNA transformation protein and related proteins